MPNEIPPLERGLIFPKLARRTFVLGSLVTVMTAALPSEQRSLGLSVPVAHARPAVDPDGAWTINAVTKEQIENRYPVKLLTFDQASTESRSYCYGENCVDIPDDWSEESLQVLDQILDRLPRHFLDLDNQGQKIQLILSNQTYLDEYPDPLNRNRIDINHGLLSPTWRKVGFSDLADVLIERANPLTFFTLRPRYYMESSWFERIYRILGGAFENPPAYLRELAYETTPEIRFLRGSSNPNTGETGTFSSRLDYAINSSYPRHLVRGFGLEYMRGRESFFSRYGRYFPEETIGQLYSFVKENIFNNTKEYSEFPI